MKKKKDDYNFVVAFWQNILLEAEIFNIAHVFRKRFNIPINGFTYQEDYDEWRQNNINKDPEWEKNRIKNCHDFIDFVKNKYPFYKGIITDTHFSLILISFYYHNEVTSETLDNYKYSGFKTLFIIKGRNFPFSSKEIDSGIYIKIGPRASIDSIKKYVENNKPLIKSYQEHFVYMEKIICKKFKINKNFNRDNCIMYLNRLGRKKLEEYGGYGISKEDKIVQIMIEVGYKGVMNFDIVKTVLQRRRKMAKAKYNL